MDELPTRGLLTLRKVQRDGLPGGFFVCEEWGLRVNKCLGLIFSDGVWTRKIIRKWGENCGFRVVTFYC